MNIEFKNLSPAQSRVLISLFLEERQGWLYFCPTANNDNDLKILSDLEAYRKSALRLVSHIDSLCNSIVNNLKNEKEDGTKEEQVQQ